MIYTMGKFVDGIPQPVGIMKIENGILTDTDDTFLRDYLKAVLERGVRLIECIRGNDGSIGERDKYIDPSDPVYIDALHSNFPPGYCIIELLKQKQIDHRKTA